MNRNCNQHKYNECEFVYLKSNAKEVLICSECVDESKGNIKLIDCIALKQILEANSSTILAKYPPLSSSEASQIVFRFSSSIDGEIKKIKEFYRKLIIDFKAAVKNAMAKSKAEIDQLIKLRKSFIGQYAQIAQIESLKQLVHQCHKDSNSEAQLRKFIDAKGKDAAGNTNKLSNQVQELRKFKESFSVEQPDKQAAKILKDLEEISFFRGSKSSFSPAGRSIIDKITISPASGIQKSTQSLKIDRINNNQIQIKNYSTWGQSTFESCLNPKKNYIIRLETIIGDRKDPSPMFYFGIMPFSLRHQELVDRQGICYNECRSCDGIATMVRGEQLHLGADHENSMQNYWRSHEERRFEVRINLQNRIVKVGSLPDYALVAEIDDKNLIDLSQEYTFAIKDIGLNNIVILEDVSEVDQFDDLM